MLLIKLLQLGLKFIGLGLTIIAKAKRQLLIFRQSTTTDVYRADATLLTLSIPISIFCSAPHMLHPAFIANIYMVVNAKQHQLIGFAAVTALHAAGVNP